MQTPEIPNSISFSALQELMTEAMPDIPTVEKLSQGEFSMGDFAEKMSRMSDEIIDTSIARDDFDPMLHKLLVLKLLVHFGTYFTTLSEQERNDSPMRRVYDAYVGQLEIAHEIVYNCTFHQRDFTAFEEQ